MYCEGDRREVTFWLGKFLSSWINELFCFAGHRANVWGVVVGRFTWDVGTTRNSFRNFLVDAADQPTFVGHGQVEILGVSHTVVVAKQKHWFQQDVYDIIGR